MNANYSVIVLSALVLGAVVLDSTAGRGGGGGARGGGGSMSRGGGSSMRSSPSVSRPQSSRPTSYSQPVSRSDFNRPTPNEFNRPAPTEFSRTDLPQASREDFGATKSAYSSGANRPSYGADLSTARPANYGSISRPAAAAAAMTAASVGGAALAANPNLGSRRPETRSTASGSLPGGADYAAASGPRGGQAGVLSGPRGDYAAIRGPGGNTVSGVRDADGDRAAVRGPRGNVVVDNVPDHCDSYYWGGHSYWHSDYYWYSPYWYNDAWHYEYRYPPTGYWYPALPTNAETVVIDDSTYYHADAMYFQAGDKDGQDGYVVVPPPATNSAGEALAILQRTCDFLGSVTSFVAEVDLDLDRTLQTGDKVTVAADCTVRVRQPDRLAVETKGAADDRTVVYDGKNFTVQDRLVPKTTLIGAPPRLEDALPGAKAEGDIVIPFGDLLQRDAFDTLSTAIQTAEYVGIRKVDGVEYHHLAFSQDDVDWQLWVQTGDQPLPMRAVIRYKQDAKAPRYVWKVRKWDLEPNIPDAAFVVDPAPAAAVPPS
jgi:hypothetical protein